MEDSRADIMSNNKIINISGGSYNESVQGNVVNISGNYIQGDSVDFSQLVLEINKRLENTIADGTPIQESQQKVAKELALEAKARPELMKKLTQAGKFTGNAAAGGLIGEAALMVIKITLGLAGINVG